MNLQERLQRFIEHKGLTYKAFETACGFGNGTAKRFNESIKKRTIDSIVANFPDLNSVWLLTGKGEMLNAETATIKTESKSASPVFMVPLINLDVRGGYDDNLEVGDEYTEQLIPWPGARSDDFAVEVSGTSMMPTIPPGSRLLLRQVNGWQEFLEFNQLYVFELKDYRRMLKNAQKSDKGDQYVRLESYNPATPSQDLPLSFVNRVYKVVGQITNYGF